MPRHDSNHGGDDDKGNCSYYSKFGACRNFDRCSRSHHKPAFSTTILVKHLYRHPARYNKTATPEENLEHFYSFFEDLYLEFAKHGRIDELCVVDNLSDYLLGHVYCKFKLEEDASDALQAMNGRYYDGRKMNMEYSPVTDLRDAKCRDFTDGYCTRGPTCSFLHAKPVPSCLVRSLRDEATHHDDAQRKRRRRERRGEHRTSRHKRRRDEDEDDDRRSSKYSRRRRHRSPSHESDDNSSSSHDDSSDDDRSH